MTKYYSLTLKITASVLHGLRKCVRELMVSDNRWLTLLRELVERAGEAKGYRNIDINIYDRKRSKAPELVSWE